MSVRVGLLSVCCARLQVLLTARHPGGRHYIFYASCSFFPRHSRHQLASACLAGPGLDACKLDGRAGGLLLCCLHGGQGLDGAAAHAGGQLSFSLRESLRATCLRMSAGGFQVLEVLCWLLNTSR